MGFVGMVMMVLIVGFLNTWTLQLMGTLGEKYHNPKTYAQLVKRAFKGKSPIMEWMTILSAVLVQIALCSGYVIFLSNLTFNFKGQQVISLFFTDED